ncbi:MAG: LysR family transcriptional regulator [Crocinitomicaceae bacterium]|nr:LysR family transcriptional regulator [Crocinitomicaceae bacterium]MDG1657118.1 LysR family transcriptional regulator [Crocinitomicaceae bacterium]
MAVKQKYHIKSRIWIHTEQGAYLGEGRVALLVQIKEHGSISRAAKAMNMSYKKAWELVNSMNSNGDEPLVIRKIGGAGGGGSELSAAGKDAIKLFNRIRNKNRENLDAELETINQDD